MPERPASDSEAATWRGYVLALPIGRPRYFERLEQIPAIVAELLASEEPDGAAVSDE